MRQHPTTLLLPLLLLGACETPSKTADPDEPTWSQDVAPIVAEHCAACHKEGGAAFSLEYYDLAKPMATAMADQVSEGRMPPWGEDETETCQPRIPFQDDLRLSDEEKATLIAWAEAGAPEGDTTSPAALPDAPALSLENADVAVAPEVAYDASGEDDQFVCFVLDPGLTQTEWLTGLQVIPGTDEVVHHVLVFTDPNAESLALADENGRYDCFGDAGVNNEQLIGAWAPGAVPLRPPENSGIEISAGTLLVEQIHYHPHGLDAEPDATTVQLQLTTTEPQYKAYLALLGNAASKRGGLLPGPDDRTDKPEFRIPANVAGHTEAMALPVSSGSYPVWEVASHMHFLGTDMLITVDHGTPVGDEPSTECLLQTPKYDYNWQRGYNFDAAVADLPVIHGGDTINLTCTYDNTLDNPGVQQALSDAGLDAPVDVALGETTLDEMCLGVFGILYE